MISLLRSSLVMVVAQIVEEMLPRLPFQGLRNLGEAAHWLSRKSHSPVVQVGKATKVQNARVLLLELRCIKQLTAKQGQIML